MRIDYQEMLNAVEQYYGTGSDPWLEIAKHGITAPDADAILRQAGVDVVYSQNGRVLSYNLRTVQNITSASEQAVNSNVPAVIKSFDVPANTGLETVTSATGEAVKQMTFKSGLAKAGNFVFTKVAPAVCAVSTGITLGKTIDKLLYNANPNFWDEHGMSTLNPDKWGDIIGSDSAGAKFLTFMLGVSPSGDTQAYMDENALAYMAMYLQSKGVFDAEKDVISINNDPYKNIISEHYNLSTTKLYRYEINKSFTYPNIGYGGGNGVYTVSDNTKPVYYIWLQNYDSNPEAMTPYFVSKDPFKLNVKIYKLNGELQYNYDVSRYDELHLNGKTFYKPYDHAGISWESLLDASLLSTIYKKDNTPTINPYSWTEFDFPLNQSQYKDILYMLIYGDATAVSSVDGVDTQSGATTPKLDTNDTVDTVLQKLKEQYPQLWTNAVTHDVVQPDNTVKTYTYVPVAMPTINDKGDPVSDASTQANPLVQLSTATESLLDTVTQLIQKAPPTNPPETGTGNTPVIPPVTGSASSLYAIYNPTLEQINSFGAWLWSDNFVDQIKKLFNDPMQAIIGLHKVYATPVTGAVQNIKVGYLDSGVASATVSNQYTTIDCGTIKLSEKFYNVFDYSPYTEINLYLPFVGIVRLDVGDVMRASIHIVYHVDVLSGACLAEVKVIRDGSGGTLYQYSGNASVTLPISSGSYMGIVSSIAGIAGGIVGTIASGGAALPMITSAAGSALNARTRVEHSGSFSGNAGAMGGKIPYLIVSRPQTALAKDFDHYIGYPANFTATIGSCKGYIKVVESHLEGINATNSELEEIDSTLKDGVIV